MQDTLDTDWFLRHIRDLISSKGYDEKISDTRYVFDRVNSRFWQYIREPAVKELIPTYEIIYSGNMALMRCGSLKLQLDVVENFVERVDLLQL
jgi:hypothetical protein